MYENIKFNDNSEYQFEFQVPPHLRSVSFSFNCEVDVQSRQKTQNLCLEKQYKANNDNSFQRVKIINGEYIVELLGKNGETKKHTTAKITLYHTLLKNNKKFKHIILESDDEGKINLGPLTEIDFFNVNGISYQKNKQEITYSNVYTLLTEEELKLPIAFNDTVQLFKT